MKKDVASCVILEDQRHTEINVWAYDTTSEKNQ